MHGLLSRQIMNDYKHKQGTCGGFDTHLEVHKTSKADCYGQKVSWDGRQRMKSCVAPITFELAVSTWLTVEDLAGALSQRGRILRRNGGLA
jgi:hypothetical protein